MSYQLTLGIGVKLNDPYAQMPAVATAQAAGADLFACEPTYIPPGQWKLARTGICLEIPPGLEIQVRPRSGLALKHGVTVLNAPGTIDSDYRGEIGVILINHSKKGYVVNTGDRIAQMVVGTVFPVLYNQVEDVSKTERGAGGFGSTGKN